MYVTYVSEHFSIKGFLAYIHCSGQGAVEQKDEWNIFQRLGGLLQLPLLARNKSRRVSHEQEFVNISIADTSTLTQKTECGGKTVQRLRPFWTYLATAGASISTGFLSTTFLSSHNNLTVSGTLGTNGAKPLTSLTQQVSSTRHTFWRVIYGKRQNSRNMSKWINMCGGICLPGLQLLRKFGKILQIQNN